MNAGTLRFISFVVLRDPETIRRYNAACVYDDDDQYARESLSW